MAGRIPQSFIDELLTRTDIVDVIDSRVQLKKAGREYKACCPFHNEKTPSFTVSQVKQFYHCFGCGMHGSAITFLMDYEHMDFVEAVEELAHRAGLEVPRDATPESHRPAITRPHYDLLEKVSAYYQQQLRSHPQASRPVEYLKKRGLSGEVVARFKIGFAPPGWDNLEKAIGTDPQTQKTLLELGLLIERDNDKGSYDRFRDRVQFPIHDRRGRTVGFGGRVLDDGTPKYLNSPESPVFHKGQELYGLYEARKAVRHIKHLLVVEGYMDVVALAQFDINYAVATLGTATTADHLERLFRTAPEIVFCFDGDRAGREAAWRALENTLPVLRDGREARFLFLPEGEDPDSLVRKIGKDEFEKRIQSATHLSDFFFERLSSQLDTSSIDGRARLVDLAKPLLSRLPDSMFSQLMTERLAALVETSAERLASRLGTAPQPAPPASTKAARRPAAGRKSPVREAIAMLLYQPSLAEQIDAVSLQEYTDIPGVSLLGGILTLLQQQPGLNTGAILEHWRDREEAPHLHRLAEWSPSHEGLDLLPELHGCLKQIRRQHIDNKINYLNDLSRQRTLDGAELEEYKHLQRRLKEV